MNLPGKEFCGCSEIVEFSPAFSELQHIKSLQVSIWGGLASILRVPEIIFVQFIAGFLLVFSSDSGCNDWYSIKSLFEHPPPHDLVSQFSIKAGILVLLLSGIE